MFLINHNLNIKLFRKREPGSGGNLTGVVPRAVNDAGNVKSRAEEDSIRIPDIFHIDTTNGVPSIVANSDGCAAFSGGKATNFALLDFVNRGEGVMAVDVLNGFA